MSDPRLSRMLRRAGSEPSEEFVSKLRRDLMAGFGDTATQTPTNGDVVADLDLDLLRSRGDGFVPLRTPPPAPNRRRWPLLAAAAVLAIVATVAVVARRHAPHTLEPSTTPEHSFSQHVSVDVQTPAGATVHVEGTVSLPQAVESNESSIQPVHDVLLLPQLNATMTNKGAQPVTIARTYVEIFLRGDRSGCTVNTTGCDSGAIVGQRQAAPAPIVLDVGQALPLDDSGSSSRISVPAGEVPFAIDQVRDGSMVVGFAVVVMAGTAGDDVASVVFDRTGHQVLSCPAAPDDCLGQSRSLLGDDAAYVPATTVADAQLPSADLPPGVHVPGSFRVRIAFTTTKPWDGVIDSAKSVVLRRSGGEPVGVIQAIALAVLRTATDRQTLKDVLSTTCPGSLDLTGSNATTLEGKAALTVSSVLSADCIVFPDLSNEKAHRGDTMRITATDIGGGDFLVAVAVASSGHWADFTSEVDALFASITPA